MSKAAQTFLKEAIDTLSDRGRTYDSGGTERTMEAACDAFSVLFPQLANFTPFHGHVLMVMIKLRRASQAMKTVDSDTLDDSLVDAVSYLALASESADSIMAAMEEANDASIDEAAENFLREKIVLDKAHDEEAERVKKREQKLCGDPGGCLYAGPKVTLRGGVRYDTCAHHDQNINCKFMIDEDQRYAIPEQEKDNLSKELDK